MDDLHAYQDRLLSTSTANEIRQIISDENTQPVAIYDPDGLESIETFVSIS